MSQGIPVGAIFPHIKHRFTLYPRVITASSSGFWCCKRIPDKHQGPIGMQGLTEFHGTVFSMLQSRFIPNHAAQPAFGSQCCQRLLATALVP